MIKNLFKTLIIVSSVFYLGLNLSQAQDAEERLKQLGIDLAKPEAPTANFVLAVRVGNLVFLSGHGPVMPDGEFMTGKVGSELTLEQGNEAARLTGISLLSSL
ncbi:MAG: RidA family protein, partial [Cyclobacteriaceae bacterium]